MAKPKVDPLLALDVAERRGIVDDPDMDSWDAILVRGRSLEDVGERLVGSGLCGAVRKDVTREALGGKLRVPAGKWGLLVQLRGQPWVLLGGVWRDYDLAEEIAKASGLETMLVGYQDTAGSTFVQYYANGKAAINFEACAFDPDEVNDPDDFEGTRFTSDRHDVKWLKQFGAEDEVRDALVKELGAYVPMLYAGGDGTIGLQAWHEDVLEAGNVERIDLVVFGPAEALTAGDAAERLQKAIAGHDAGAVRKAIAEGADVRFLAGRSAAPLAYAIDVAARDRWTTSVEVVRVLLEAGADANGERSSNPPIFKAMGTISFDAAQSIELIGLLVKHGADVNVEGRTGLEKGRAPLHVAAGADQMAVVKFLIANGADAKKTDGQGRTAREAVEASMKFWAEQIEGEQAEAMAAKSRELIAFLKEAEAGTARTDDVQALAEENRKEELRRRRKAKVAFGELGELFKAIGQVMEKGSKKAAAKLAVMAQPDEIHVEKAKNVRWKNAKQRDVVAKQLERLGFRRIGVFTVKETPDVRMLAMIDPGRNVYAAVSEMGKVRWLDLVRYHRDGTVLTVTNSVVPPAARANLKEKPRVRMAKGRAKAMVEAMDRRRRPKAGVEEIKAEDFAGRVERYYAEEMAARKARDRGRARKARARGR
jgi:hypothetical protein